MRLNACLMSALFLVTAAMPREASAADVQQFDPTEWTPGPIPAKLPLGIMSFGRPFSEPTLFRIASACEAATKHLIPPPDFGPVSEP
jgi:hypothetical protein